jgi:hypothetical protein
MTAEHFSSTLLSFQRRVPFRSYVVELVGGDQIQVDHPEALVVRGGFAFYLSTDGAPAIFDHEGVAQVFSDPETSAA